MKKYILTLLFVNMALLGYCQTFLGVDFSKLTENPVTYNTFDKNCWSDTRKRFESLGIDEVTDFYHIKGVGNLDPMPTKNGRQYAEKIQFFDKEQTHGVVSVKKGKYKDLFRWTLLYATKRNKFVMGKFILYGFKNDKEAFELQKQIRRKTEFSSEVLDKSSTSDEKYVVVTIPKKVYGDNKDSKRLNEIKNIRL